MAADLTPGFYVAWHATRRPVLVEYAPQRPRPWRSAFADPIGDPRDYEYTLERAERAPPLAATAPSAMAPAAFHQQLGIDGSKFAMHGTVTSTTPPAAPAAVTEERLRACGWDRPVLGFNDRFKLWDDGDPHGKVYLVCPGGTMVGFGSCEGDIDEQRVRFIMDACNAALSARQAP